MFSSAPSSRRSRSPLGVDLANRSAAVFARAPAILLTLLALRVVVPAAAQPSAGTLFPTPFVVEHQLIQTDADGTVYYSEPVRDTYGGSWLVSERADGSRLIIDLSRRQLTEIRPADGKFWTIDFDRLARLHADLVAAEDADVQRLLDDMEAKNARLLGSRDLAADKAPEILVEEPSDPMPHARKRLLEQLPSGFKASRDARVPRQIESKLLDDPALIHLRVRVADDGWTKSLPAGVALPAGLGEPPVLDVWLDPRLRLTPAARRALKNFEQDVLGPPPARRKYMPVTPSLLIAEARDHAEGAFPVRTVRSLHARPELPDSGIGVLEDVALSLERIETFPPSLVEIPEGLRRVLHPMEMILQHAERERILRDAQQGVGDPKELERVLGGGR